MLQNHFIFSDVLSKCTSDMFVNLKGTKLLEDEKINFYNKYKSDWWLFDEMGYFILIIIHK